MKLGTSLVIGLIDVNWFVSGIVGRKCFVGRGGVRFGAVYGVWSCVWERWRVEVLLFPHYTKPSPSKITGKSRRPVILDVQFSVVSL